MIDPTTVANLVNSKMQEVSVMNAVNYNTAFMSGLKEGIEGEHTLEVTYVGLTPQSNPDPISGDYTVTPLFGPAISLLSSSFEEWVLKLKAWLDTRHFPAKILQESEGNLVVTEPRLILNTNTLQLTKQSLLEALEEEAGGNISNIANITNPQLVSIKLIVERIKTYLEVTGEYPATTSQGSGVLTII